MGKAKSHFTTTYSEYKLKNAYHWKTELVCTSEDTLYLPRRALMPCSHAAPEGKRQVQSDAAHHNTSFVTLWGVVANICTRQAIYVYPNTASRSPNHCCNGKATMRPVLIIYLNDLVNNKIILIVEQEWFLGKYMSPATKKHLEEFM